MEGNSKYELVIRKFANSPAHMDEDVKHRNPSFKRQMMTPSIGPSRKEIKTINTLPKSSFKKLAPNSGNGISKKLTAKDNATNTAIKAIRLVVNRFLKGIFCVKRVPAPSFFCVSSTTMFSFSISTPRIFFRVNILKAPLKIRGFRKIQINSTLRQAKKNKARCEIDKKYAALSQKVYKTYTTKTKRKYDEVYR